VAKAKQTTTGRRYSASEKAQILAVAKKENLTGAQVRKRFGVSTLSFYRWRGPVRRRRAGATVVNGRRGSADGVLRAGVRSRVEQVLPEVIRQEVAAYLDRLLPSRALTPIS
jgi:transposase-like protein